MNKKLRNISTYIFFSMGFTLLFSFLFMFLVKNEKNFIHKIEEIKDELYFSMISISFVIISFVTFLSNKVKKIYWVDVIEYKLTKPKFLGAIDTTFYIIGIILTATLIYLFPQNIRIIDNPKFLFWELEFYNEAIMILMCFILNLILIIIITIRLASAYLFDEKLEYKLKKEYNSMREKNIEKFEELKYKLIEATYLAIKEKDNEAIIKNIKLLCFYPIDDFEKTEEFKNIICEILLEKKLFIYLLKNEQLSLTFIEPTLIFEKLIENEYPNEFVIKYFNNFPLHDYYFYNGKHSFFMILYTKNCIYLLEKILENIRKTDKIKDIVDFLKKSDFNEFLWKLNQDIKNQLTYKLNYYYIFEHINHIINKCKENLKDKEILSSYVTLKKHFEV